MLRRSASHASSATSFNVAPFDPTARLTDRRSAVHTDNLKWQQDMFHRLLHLSCLAREGLAPPREVQACKAETLHRIVEPSPPCADIDEWPEFTRSKLLFLQDLLYATCISEKEYHNAKNTLILRLADQGAMIDTDDFIFDTSNPIKNHSKVIKEVESKRALRLPSPLRKAWVKLDDSGTATTTQMSKSTNDNGNAKLPTPASPFKQVMGTLSRLSKSPSRSKSYNKPSSPFKAEKVSGLSQLTRPFGFRRAQHCPERDPPLPADHYEKSMQVMNKRHGEPVLDLEMDLEPRNDQKMDPFLSYKDTFTGYKDVRALEKDSMNKAFGNTPTKFKATLNGFAQNKHDQLDLHNNESEEDEDFKSSFELKQGKWSSLTNINVPEKSRVPSGVDISSFQYSSNGNDSNDDNDDVDEEDDDDRSSSKCKKGLSAFSLPQHMQFDDYDNGIDTDDEQEDHHAFSRSVVETKRDGANKKRFENRANYPLSTPSDVSSNKVLGENVKNELSRIRANMTRIQRGQLFTNEQIDAIAKRLPRDKSELKKLFPQAWCERYGDVVLEVVQREHEKHKETMAGKPIKPTSPSLKKMGESPLRKPSPERFAMQHGTKHRAPERTADFDEYATNLDDHTAATAAYSRSPRTQTSSRAPRRDPNTRNSARQSPYVGPRFGDFKLEEETMRMPMLRRPS